MRDRSSVGKTDPNIGPPAASAPPHPQLIELTLPAECTISSATALKEQLGGAMGHPQVALDIDSLQRIDTAAMQLLASFVRERAAGGLDTGWQGSAPVLGTAARLLGLTTVLKLPE